LVINSLGPERGVIDDRLSKDNINMRSFVAMDQAWVL